MSGNKLEDLESEDLAVHVAISRERHLNYEKNFKRIEKKINDIGTEIKKELSEVKKLLIWAASTLFGTMLLALITTAFKVF